jgi:hypothetical protein
VDCLPGPDHLAAIKSWAVYTIAKEITENNPQMSKFSGMFK